MTTPKAAPSATPTPPSIQRIGRFHILRELGRGTTGCVYVAHDPVVGRDIALKTFNPRLTPAEKARHEQQFINEARAAGRLSHPHIVTIYDASSENGTTYIAMEYLQGRELSRMLATGHRFTPEDTASIGWKIADALDHAHRNDVIHRDIKPSNIFMVNEEHPKLVDFGIARSPNRVAPQLVHTEDAYTLFQHDHLLGTPNYMSPEQARGEPVDHRTDIYSLGAVMYEMLTGRKLFGRSKDADELLKQVMYKTPRSPSDIDPTVSPELSRVVMKAISKQAEKRHETAEQMATELKRYLVKERRARRKLKQPNQNIPKERKGKPATRDIQFWLGCSALLIAAILAARHFL